MKRLFCALSVVLTFLLLSACSGLTGPNAAASPETDSGPRVSFASPEPEASVPLGPVQVLILSEDLRGTAQVEVLVNGVAAASVPSPDTTRSSVIVEYVWQPAAIGKYVLQAHGQNNAGTWGDFAALEVTVVEAAGETTPTLETPTATLEPTSDPTDVITTPSAETTEILPTPTKSGISLSWSFSALRMYSLNSACEPQKNGVIVRLSGIDKSQVDSIMIFFRAKHKDTGALGKWSKALRMELFESGAYGRGFSSAHFAQPLPFVPAIILHQFVVTDKSKTIIYRSDVYQEMYLAPCNP